MKLPKIEFTQNIPHRYMDNMIVDGKSCGTIPRWLIDLLPKEKQVVAYNTIKEVYRSGFMEGQSRKSKEVHNLLNILNNI